MKTLKGWLVFVLLGGVAAYAVAEELTLTTYYPSPRGVYKELRTTDSTYLAVDGGSVGIGTAGPWSRLQINGSAGEPSLTHQAPGVASFTSAGVNLDLVISQSASSPYATSIQSRSSVADGFAYPIAFNPLGGNVGIGTTTPSAKLEIIDGGYGQTGLKITETAASNGFPDITLSRTAAPAVDWTWLVHDSDASSRWYNPAHGYVMSLDVNGNLGIPGCFGYNGGSLGSCASDAALKENILPVTGALEKLAQLTPVRFTWKDGAPPSQPLAHTGPQWGLVAQDVEQVLPELVSEDAQGYKRVTYGSELNMLMLQAIKELKAQNDHLRAEVDELKQQRQDD